jgi:hypothetical protein
VPIHEDEQFERYLKEFHPLAPDALPTEKRKDRRAPRIVALAAWVAAAAAVLGVVALTIFPRLDGTHSSLGAVPEFSTERLANTQPLTVRRANALLATAPSFEEAVEEMAFPPPATQLPKDKHSALAVLSKEEIKP